MTTKVVFDISLTIILLTAKTVFGLNSILNFDQKNNPTILLLTSQILRRSFAMQVAVISGRGGA